MREGGVFEASEVLEEREDGVFEVSEVLLSVGGQCYRGFGGLYDRRGFWKLMEMRERKKKNR